MAPATPTQSVYLHAGEGPVDATVWPLAGFQTPPSTVEGQPVPSEPLYYFAGDTIEPKTTNGASVPDWGLYTGPTEPVAAQDATTVAEPTGQSAEAQPAASQAPADPSQAQTTAPTGGEQAAPSAPTSEQPAVQTDASSSPTDTSPPSSEPTPSGSGSGEAGVSSTPSVAENAPQDASAPTAGAPGAPEDPQTASTATETVPAASAPTPTIPGVVEGVVYRARTDSDVISGAFCRVVAGEHQGRYGVLVRTETVFVADGWPATVTVRTRDANDEYLIVNYADIRPAAAGGR